VSDLQLSNAVADRTRELIHELSQTIIDRHCTDGVTFALHINALMKGANKDVRSLIGDSGYDGRFVKRKGREVVYPDENEIPVDRAGRKMYNKFGDKLDIADRS
jgi:hypothetical protein